MIKIAALLIQGKDLKQVKVGNDQEMNNQKEIPPLKTEVGKN